MKNKFYRYKGSPTKSFINGKVYEVTSNGKLKDERDILDNEVFGWHGFGPEWLNENFDLV